MNTPYISRCKTSIWLNFFSVFVFGFGDIERRKDTGNIEEYAGLSKMGPCCSSHQSCNLKY